MKDKSHNDVELKYIDQKNEGLEAWIRKDKSDWIRLDFMLEYYLSRNVNLSKQYKGQLRDETIARQFYNLLYTKFSDDTSGGRNFDFQKYLSWQRSNYAEISNALKLMNT
ncbi:hypothetical protein SAMN04488109_1135 [Chryseolinea serpens]|uniref:Uncharacterized protein n=1 Tax=Chryseolinea serpens TaxID=947013 RepID=A0A1M5LCC9_9BACT|nr:hypothetical protein [Chryseolinea serpens]SHG62668.1 hypothetical protein SAMN04488109_1135 [Chryseolinea serpens]